MKADLHVHTTYSVDDGVTKPEQVIEMAKKRGFGCIAVTDHNSFEAYFDIKDNGDIIIIPAEEVSSAKGHILGYGIDREIEQGLSVLETINKIHEAGGIAIAAHPYRAWNGLGEENVIPEFDGVEALNARSKPKANRKSKVLAIKFGKIITAGSDAHRPSRIGDGYTIIPDDCKTWQDVIQALKDGNTQVVSSSRSLIVTVLWSFKTFFKFSFRGFRKI